MGNLDQDKLWSSVPPKTSARLWVIEHFRVLPTDERYLNLDDNQINVLYGSWLHSLPDEYVKREYWSNKKETTKITEVEEVSLHELGYTEDEIAAIKKELGNG